MTFESCSQTVSNIDNRFVLEPFKTEGTVRIKDSEGLCMNVAGARTDNWAPVISFSCESAANNVFYIVWGGSG